MVLASAPMAGSGFVVFPQNRQPWQDYSVYPLLCDRIDQLELGLLYGPMASTGEANNLRGTWIIRVIFL
jgi:hypothetical protein